MTLSVIKHVVVSIVVVVCCCWLWLGLLVDVVGSCCFGGEVHLGVV